MKTLTLGLAFGLLATQGLAQQTLSTASPIPDGAETRFCYYQGMAYSLDAFVVIFGDNTVTSTASTREEHLLRCIKGDDGTMSWKPQSSFQISR
ncbi:hypothetical protein [Ruegeria halocynthiae]|uniref:hypothetical protein n=1 Tax=Ruegeria halocynthiae TaxID=985054 RepID=UPI000568EA21|nr:hypothetical protein [Ruegeria halocynthiae]